MPVATPIVAAPIPVAPPIIATSWHLRGEPNFDVPASGTLTIGRVAGNDWVINDAGVSSKHATLQIGLKGLTIADLGSTNGTHLNGQKLAPNAPTPLKNGDVIKLGRLPFRVEKS